MQAVASPGQDLVGVGLVADIPEDLVLRGIQDRVERDGDLHRAQVRAEVATDLADGVDDVFAHLLRERLKLII